MTNHDTIGYHRLVFVANLVELLLIHNAAFSKMIPPSHSIHGDYHGSYKGMLYPYPPPGYPHPYHPAAFYYPHSLHHHPPHPAMFYPPGSLPPGTLPHHHINPMNHYPMPSMDPALYPSMPHMISHAPPAVEATMNKKKDDKSDGGNSSQLTPTTVTAVPRGSSPTAATSSGQSSSGVASNAANKPSNTNGSGKFAGSEGLSSKSSPPLFYPNDSSFQVPSPPSTTPNTSATSTIRKSMNREKDRDDTASPCEDSGPVLDANGKPLTKEQFYKIRPKVPRISKGDPRRLYAAAFGDAYNSCDFDKIWEFVSTYCAKDVLFVHRWVGTELYLNFPKYLEVRGIESVAEYWFSRCLVAPDLVLELKETKLYVRSDGISTVLSSFTIVCTRLYDGEISDSIICRPAVDADLQRDQRGYGSGGGNNSGGESDGEFIVSSLSRHNSEDLTVGNGGSGKPEEICNRVLEKVERILCKVEPPPKRRTIGKRKMSDDSLTDVDINSSGMNGSGASSESTFVNSTSSSSRKRMPKDTSITLLGTVTLHLNEDFKIRQIELNFALQQ